jgi:signal transduction histidine kinase
VTQEGYALIGLTAIVAMLVSVLTFAVLRFAAGARDTKRHLGSGGADSAILAAALQEAVTRLKAQGQAMSARAVASEELSGQIVSSLTAGLLVVDGAGTVEILNPAGQQMLGVQADVAGHDYRTVLAPVPPLVEAIAECLGTRRAILRRSLQVPGPERSTHLGVTVSPLGGPEGRGAICLFSDLTNVVELEEQLRLKETLARLGELTAGIAHEFRNGLATIHGYSRLIVPDALPEPYRPYVEGIRQETEALGKVVTNFLNFARPERVVFSRVELEPLLRRLVEDLQHELPAGTRVEVGGTFSDVDGDEVLLRQVFSNLVRNAAEACESAGVTPAIVMAGDVDARRHTCRISVEDNGPGIPEAERARVFQPFVTTRSRGTGLGLAIVQKIVVMHNGRVGIGTSPAGGASVDVTLPLAAAQ